MASFESVRREKTLNVHPDIQDTTSTEKERSSHGRGDFTGEKADRATRSGSAVGLDVGRLSADTDRELSP